MDKECEDADGSGEPGRQKDPLKVVQSSQSPESLSAFDIGRAVQEIISSSSDTLDLSRQKLCQLNEDIFRVPNIKHLYLQGNDLPRIPEDFFQQLTNLVWLDMRFNKITSLPPGIGDHRHLKSLLLEGNPITSLPVELGDLTSLKALNLRNCPLEFPPLEVVRRGLPAIQSFLQKARVGHWEPIKQPVQEVPAHLLEEAKRIVKKYRRMSKKYELPSKDFPGFWKRKSSHKMPPVEKLKLNGLMKSSLESSEDWPNEQEMRLFQNLKHQIILSEKQEFFEGQRLALEDGSGNSRKKRSEKSVLTLRKKTMLNDPLVYDIKIRTKRDEERQISALTQLKQQQTSIEQRIRDREILFEWRKQTRTMQEKKPPKERTASASRFPPATGQKVPRSAPYATDFDRNVFVDTAGQKMSAGAKYQDNNRRMSLKTVKEMAEERTSRDIELEQRIKQHIQQMQEKRRRPNDIQAAKEDLDQAEMLQTQLLQLKAGGSPLEYRFKAFTGELSPPPTPAPTRQSQNNFSKQQF